MQGRILVISGPSGSGKSSILSHSLAHSENFYFSVSTTTRAIRDGEVDGVSYHFVDIERFKYGIENDEFLEWAEVHGNYYGTSLVQVKDALSQSKLVIFDVDVQGYHSIKSKMGNLVTSLFITTPNISILEERLKKRQTDSQEIIDKRLVNAISEMSHIKEYDFVIINDDFDKSLKEFKNILHYVQNRSYVNLESFISEWKKR